jgi:hypothetical protein
LRTTLSSSYLLKLLLALDSNGGHGWPGLTKGS